MSSTKNIRDSIPFGAHNRTLLDRVAGAYRRLAGEGRSVLLAVSGGADSTALLLATAEVGAAVRLRAEVACVDHGLRAGAGMEAERVEALAREHHLPFHRLEAHVEAGAGVEARAREVRYRTLERARAAAGLDFVATAHTATDQAETLLMRLSRGASLSGARGILERRGAVIRPLLGWTREEVEAFLAGRGVVPAADDPMNRDPRFLRVRFRRRVLPALVDAAGTSAVRHLARFAAFAAEDEALLSALASDALRRLSLGDGALDAPGARALHPAVRRRVLALWLEARAVERTAPALEGLTSALMEGGRAPLPGRRWASAAGGRLRLVGPDREVAGPAGGTAAVLSPGEVVAHAPSGLEIGLGRAPLPGAGSVLPLDLAPARPLQVRTRRRGDRVRSARGRRKLQDALTDLKVPRESRDGWPLVAEEDGDVLWVVGLWPRGRGGESPSGWYLSARPIYNRQ